MNAKFISVLIFVLSASQIESLMFHLKSNVKKCLKEEIHKDILVKGDYYVSDVHGHHTKLEVLDSKGHLLYNKDEATKGKFAFTTDEYDVFQICFETKVAPEARNTEGIEKEVHIYVKHGVEAKDYENVNNNFDKYIYIFQLLIYVFFFKKLAKVEKLKPLEVELRRLEDLSQDIVSDFAYMKAREEEMRNTNESTNSKVLYFSVFSMCCLLGLAIWQVLYLRRYFKAKKLIE